MRIFNVVFCVFGITFGRACDGLRGGIFDVLFLFDDALLYLVSMLSLGCVFGVFFSRFCCFSNCFGLVYCDFIILHFAWCG